MEPDVGEVSLAKTLDSPTSNSVVTGTSSADGLNGNAHVVPPLVVERAANKPLVGGFSGGSVCGTSALPLPCSLSPSIPLSFIDANQAMAFAMSAPDKGPDLIHVPMTNNTDSCSLLAGDFGETRNIWKLCLIGYTIGKTPGYTVLGKFMTNVWKCNVTLNIHDSGWLVFIFSSEIDL